MNRGNRKVSIFEDDRDRRRFLRILIEEKERYGVDLLAGSQMGIIFILCVGTPHGNLSEFMEQLEGRFARYSNWRHGRVGHLFQGRFRHVVIEHDIHLLTALCYVFLNPVSARLVTRLEDYKWSTYAATVGLAPLPRLPFDRLARRSLFRGDSLRESQRRFRDLMSEAQPVIAYLRQGMTGCGPESVKRVLRSYVGRAVAAWDAAADLPVGATFPAARTGPAMGCRCPLRAAAIYEAHVIHGYTLAEIARELRLHPSTVSRDVPSHLPARELPSAD